MNRFGIIFVILVGAACASPPPPSPPPPPVVITKEVPRIVRETCKDSRPDDKRRANVDLPTDPESISAVPEGDFERLSTIYKAAVDMLLTMLDLAELQIKSCGGEQ